MKNPFESMFGAKKEAPVDDENGGGGARGVAPEDARRATGYAREERPTYTGEEELTINPMTGDVKSPELEKLDKTFADR